jgi:imidazole glycerol-phosphate synthase subunit HisH
MIALLDYGSGNIRSVEKALVAAGGDVDRVSGPGSALDRAQAMVLPGVGAFDDCLNAMRRQSLDEAAARWIDAGRPFLGICVGYQALFDRSEEFNSCARGLGVFKGPVVRFRAPDSGLRLKVPQIGWNQVVVGSAGGAMFAGLPSGSYFYFVHSFFPKPEDTSIVAGITHYGGEFASAVCRGNVWATQFHPEKSQTAGLRLLGNFIQFARRA